MKMAKTVLILAFLTLSILCDTVESDIQGKIDGGATQYQETEQESCEHQWVYLDEPYQFAAPLFQTTEETVFNFEGAIGKNIKARKAQFLLYISSGYTSKGTTRIRTKVINGKKEMIHWTFISCWPQNALNSNSETFEIPIYRTRQVRIQADKIHDYNRMHLYIVAYQPY